MHSGELIRQQRKLKGFTQQQLADMIGVSGPSIRLYELGKRTPNEAILEKIAGALEIAPEALHAYQTDSAREVLEMLFRMEYEYGLVPFESDGNPSLTIDKKAPKAAKLAQAIDVWHEMNQKLDAGEITQEEYDAWKTSFQG